GNDLLAKNRSQTVAFRNGDFVTPQFVKQGSTVYDTKTGAVIKPNATQKKTLAREQNHVTSELSLSDRVIQGDLLRFYQLKDFKSVDKTKFNYKYTNGIQQLKDAQKSEPTSLMAKNHGKATADYKTDAPELK
ncbi:MAG TPA: glycerol phosphate lipoteichoic acid synthase, partial [Lactobacillus sp.]|nr:glycerol phosphate lipoteichoic acid synthase [Lactobacillus sp.]